MDLNEMLWAVAYWIHLAKGKAQWWVVVNTIMNFRFHNIGEISRSVEQLSAFQEVFCFMVIILYSDK
jgi:hypothetical protein